MRSFNAIPIVLSATLLSGCFGVMGGSNGLYYGGGGITLFLLIIGAALLFGRRR